MLPHAVASTGRDRRHREPAGLWLGYRAASSSLLDMHVSLQAELDLVMWNFLSAFGEAVAVHVACSAHACCVLNLVP